MIYVLYAVLALWGVLNVVVAVKCSMREMANDFWVDQNVFGKICANAFYAPAWVLSAVILAVVVVLYWLFKVLHIVSKFGVKVFYPFYENEIHFN